MKSKARIKSKTSAPKKSTWNKKSPSKASQALQSKTVSKGVGKGALKAAGKSKKKLAAARAVQKKGAQSILDQRFAISPQVVYRFDSNRPEVCQVLHMETGEMLELEGPITQVFPKIASTVTLRKTVEGEVGPLSKNLEKSVVALMERLIESQILEPN